MFVRANRDKGLAHVLTTSVVALLLAMGAAPADDPELTVIDVSTSTQLRDAWSQAHQCTGPVEVRVSGAIDLDNTYARNEQGHYLGTPSVDCDYLVSIVGVTPDAALTYAGTDEFGVVHTESISGTLEVRGLTVEGFVPEQRAAISSYGLTTIRDSVFLNNVNTHSSGGAVWTWSIGRFFDSHFEGNVAIGEGGAVYATQGMALYDISARDNQAGSGGAFHSNGDALIRDSWFDSNSATDGNGGAVTFSNGTVSGSSFVGNSATHGGAMETSGLLEVVNTTFAFNESSSSGGAFHADKGGMATFVTIAHNSQVSGGSVTVGNHDFTIAGSVVVGTSAPTDTMACTSAGTGVFLSAGYNAFSPEGCVADVMTTDLAVEAGNDFGLASLEALEFGYALPPLSGGPLEDGVPRDDPLCTDHEVDQRAAARPQGRGCDIGAVEIASVLEPYFVAAEAPFVDVPLTHNFVDEIAWLADSGISGGYSDGTFRPSAEVTRQALAAFLYRFADIEDWEAPAQPTFTDVPTTHPYFEHIEWLVSEGIARGYGDGTFRPTAPVTRQAVAAFLFRYTWSAPVRVEQPSFSDTPKIHPFYREIEWLAAMGIASGYDDGTFRGGAAVTRQAISAFLYRMYFDYRP